MVTARTWGAGEGGNEVDLGTKQAVLKLCAGQEYPENAAITAFLGLCRSHGEPGTDFSADPALPCTHDSHGNLEFAMDALIQRVQLCLPALSQLT